MKARHVRSITGAKPRLVNLPRGTRRWAAALAIGASSSAAAYVAPGLAASNPTLSACFDGTRSPADALACAHEADPRLTSIGVAALGTSAGVLLLALLNGRRGAEEQPAPLCSNHAPVNGETVTCVFDTDPATETPFSVAVPIIGPGSTDVTVNIDGPGLQDPGGITYLGTGGIPVIDLGGGAAINLTGAAIADVDPETLSETLQQALAGGAGALPDREALVDFFAALADLVPDGPTPDHATVELGIADPADVMTAIGAAIIDNTVQKAATAERARNLLSVYMGTTDPEDIPPDYTDLAAGAAGYETGNSVDVSGGIVLSEGAAAIRTGDTSSLGVRVTGGGTIATIVDNSSAITTGDASALWVSLGELDPASPSGGTILTIGDGSAGIRSDGENTALSVFMLSDAHIFTAGDDAAGIVGPNESSIFLLDARGGNSSDGLPMLATFGANAPGITVGGASSVATLHIRDVGDTAYGPGFQTNGANSTLFDIGMGGNSSTSFRASASSFGTVGDGSAVVSIANGEGSDQTVVLDDVRIVSEGSNAPGLLVSLTDRDSVGNIVAVGTSISTAGDRSGGIVWRTGGNDSLSVNNLTLADVDIATLGDDAPALLVERGGQVSARTTIVQDFDFSTEGDRSSGMVIGGLLQGSETEIDLAEGVVVTAGDSAHGIVIGEVVQSPLDLFEKSVLIDLSSIDITTTGNDAIGLLLQHSGSDDQGSEFGTTLFDITVSTSGDASHGIVLGEGLRTGLPTTINELTLAGVSATTSGAEAHALVIGENATLTLDADNLGETTDRGTIVSGLIDTFDGFVATGAGSRAVLNHGTIYGTFTVGDEIVGNLANNGLIESADGPTGVAVQFTGTTDDIFELRRGHRHGRCRARNGCLHPRW